MGWHDVPRLAKAPDYETFMRDYALPRRPFILEAGCAKSWGWAAADGRWKDLDYLADHPQVLAMESLFQRPEGFRPVVLRAVGRSAAEGHTESGWSPVGLSCPMTPRGALKRLKARADIGHWGDDGVAMYLRAWEYDADDWQSGSSASSSVRCIAEDVTPGPPFASCTFEKELGASHPLPRSLRWIYIGEPGSGSPAHVDPLATHAWMYQAAGQKAWRLVRRDPASDAIPADPREQQEGPPPVEDPDGIFQASGAPAPEGVPGDLFSPKSCHLVAAWADAAEARDRDWGATSAEGSGWCAWAAELREGEVIYIPAGVLHGVQNVAPGLSVAISHNFVNGANTPEVLGCADVVLQRLQKALELKDDHGSHSSEAEAAEAIAKLEEVGALDAQGAVMLTTLLGEDGAAFARALGQAAVSVGHPKASAAVAEAVVQRIAAIKEGVRSPCEEG